MRRIYLVRHAHPGFPLGARVCLGRTDLPLGAFGRMQAYLLGRELSRQKPLSCFSSPLIRCRQTAEAMHQPYRIEDDLAEQNMGTWDGLDFETIRRKDPALYQARETDPLLVPPGAETLAQVQERVLPALQRCVDGCSGDVAVFTHASAIQAILASVTGVPLAQSWEFRLPYVAFSILAYGEDFKCITLKESPHPEMTPELAENLLLAAAPGKQVEAHSRAVAEKAMEIADLLPVALDRNALCCAALLHDVARTEKNHASVGADWINALGYQKEAEIIRQHHDLESDAPEEAAVLYISDKCIQEDHPVSIEERFAHSALRCNTEEARAAHAYRLETARTIQQRINSLCGQPIIP